MWSFYQYHFIWDMFILFVTSTFLIYGHNFPLLSYSGCLAKVSQTMAVSTFPWLDFSSIIHLCLMRTSLPVLSLFISLACIYLWSIHFVKCHLDLSLGDTESVQWYALLSVHELGTRGQWRITKRFERSKVFGHWSGCISITYVAICGPRN